MEVADQHNPDLVHYDILELLNALGEYHTHPKTKISTQTVQLSDLRGDSVELPQLVEHIG